MVPVGRAARALAGRLGPAVRGESGQALLEFALVMPVLLALLIGIMELGQAWRTSQLLTQAAREGARLAVVPNSTSETVGQRIRDVLSQGGLDPARAELVLTLQAGTGTMDTVTVRYPVTFPLLGPVVRLVTPSATTTPPGAVTLTSTFVMRNE